MDPPRPDLTPAHYRALLRPRERNVIGVVRVWAWRVFWAGALLVSAFVVRGWAQDATEPWEAPVLVSGTGGEPVLPVLDGSEDLSMLPGLALQVAELIRSEKYETAVALALTALVFLVRLFVLKRVPPESTRWVVLGLSVATQLAAALAVGADWSSALFHAVGVALMSVGAWEMGGRVVLPKTAVAAGKVLPFKKSEPK